EVEEAAWIDGCSVLGGIVRVVLPLSLPGIATIAIFAFTLSMQEYLYAAVFAAPVDQKVVTVGLPTMLIRGDIYFWGSLMAGALLVGVPTAIAFNVVLDRFVQGLTGVGEAWPASPTAVGPWAGRGGAGRGARSAGGWRGAGRGRPGGSGRRARGGEERRGPGRADGVAM